MLPVTERKVVVDENSEVCGWTKKKTSILSNIAFSSFIEAPKLEHYKPNMSHATNWLHAFIYTSKMSFGPDHLINMNSSCDDMLLAFHTSCNKVDHFRA